MEYNIPVERKDYYKAILMVINFNLNLSNLEMDILSILLNNGLTVVNIDARDLLRKELNKDKFITNNYIKRLRDKGVLLSNDKNKDLNINPNILSIIKDGKISFEFEIHETNELQDN